MNNTSVCIKCGKVRIVSKQWKETINNSTVTFTETVCPDPDCQKQVENELNKKNEKVAAIREASLKRKENNKRNKKPKKK